jgi:Ca2+-binding EF-hand superfamily protein
MLPFDQKTDMYRPANRLVHYPEVDIVRTLKNANPTVEDVIEKIQKITKQRSLRISEFMRDYDPLRSGSITKTQFLESLSMLHLFLSRQEAELLCEKYANHTPGRENEILWTKFADDIDIVFVIKHLEQRDDINQVLDITKKDFKLNELSLPDQATLQEILKAMKKFFEVNRIEPKPLFFNHDRLQRGKVLKPQFKNVMHGMKFNISDDHIDVLMKKYGDPISNEINYVNILNDAATFGENPKDKKDENISSMQKLTDKEFVPSLSNANNFYTYQTYFVNLNSKLKDIMDKIKHTVKINRIRLNLFFEDFDPLRKGTCTKAKFRTALDMANLNLREEEFQFLENFYSVPDQEDKVFYKDLVEEVETVFTLKELEKDPLLRPQEYKIPDFLNPEKKLNQQENEFLDRTMRKLALLVRKYRVAPKTFFKDADRANIGIIASSKFSSILSTFRLNVDEKEMNILIKRFCGKSMIEINYFDFDDCLKKYVSLIEEEKEREEDAKLAMMK